MSYRELTVYICCFIECHIPSSPRHGDVTVSVNDSKAVYTCDVSYSVSGTTERYCQTDGSGWSDEEPSCGMRFKLSLHFTACVCATYLLIMFPYICT